MEHGILFLGLLIACCSAASLPPLSFSTETLSVDAVEPSSREPLATTPSSGRTAESTTRKPSSTTTPPVALPAVTTSRPTRPRRPVIVIQPSKDRVTFNDWFSQLSIWIQIPLAIVIFFALMILLVILLNIIFFWCTFCCACCLACFIPNEYIAI
ncbi:uncharacterized protein LOC100905842 [Galendromus occidentalis]|uniref:Uncharacterized protein LOC100905842 n=1 Tax=Galendromus occidentalis TaxID=34638 RepID=A0AAJ6QYJ4_9ACAR|nr:uncharacterized protein LOC100905842 [Galendromus occidentalis]